MLIDSSPKKLSSMEPNYFQILFLELVRNASYQGIHYHVSEIDDSVTLSHIVTMRPRPACPPFSVSVGQVGGTHPVCC